MARVITKRIKITGTLTAETPLHIGGLATDPTVDLPLAVNGKSQEYIPGTSFAGAFRNWMEDCKFSSNIIDSIWGFQKDNAGHASFVIIEDAVVKLPEGATTELRDHVGIDRVYGAASDKTKFDRAILPKGTTFPLEITIDLGKDNPQALEAIEKLIHALSTDGLRLGGAKTRGLGLVKLTETVWNDYDFSTFAGMIATLKGNGKAHNPIAVSTSHLLHLSIHWKPIGALMVKSGQDGVAVDILPLVSRVGQETTFVLPGSAIKGAVRSQAERILRTVLKQEQQPIGTFQSQLEDNALELTQWLFGKSGTGSQSKEVTFGRGALSIDDCYCKKRMKPSTWDAIEHSADDRTQQQAGTLRGALDAATLTDTQQAYHVAIDRWTGGAAEHMLYSALEPFNLEWEPIELTLNLNRIDNANRPAAKALLLFILRDMARGQIPLGYGVNRGYGSLEVESVSLQAAAANEFGGDEIVFESDGSIVGIDITEMGQDWSAWLSTTRESLGVAV